MMDDLTKQQESLRQNASWSPHPKQAAALERPEFEIGFGGARGGGKTDAGLSWILFDSKEPLLRGLVVRKNSDDLKDWISRARYRYCNDQFKATITGNPPVLHFPDGATYVTGHFKDENAYTKYQGQEFQRILVEELELIPSEESYEMLLASCRSTIQGVHAQVFSTFNPGGPGHTWIKKRFRLEGIPNQPIITKDERTGRMRVFVPSRVEDNPTLLKNDPEYVHFLEGLPDGLREQWRWGSWDNPIIKGAYYTLELEQARRDTHITDVPHTKEYGVHTWWDIGRDMTSIGFFQFIENKINVIDYYQNDSKGLTHYLAKLQELRETRGYMYATHHFPHDIEHKEWGSDRTRIEVLEEAGLEIDIVPKLSLDDGVEAVRLIFSRVYFDQRRTPALVDGLTNYRKEWDEEKQVFKKEPLHDWASHPSDMFRYFAVSNHHNIEPKKSSELGRLKRDASAATGNRKPFSGEFDSGQAESGVKSRFHTGD